MSLPETDPQEASSLRIRVLSAVKWLSLGRAISQIASWAFTIVVVRLLTPQDYGLMAAAGVMTSFLYLLNDGNLGSSLVQQRVVSNELERQVFGVVVLLNLACFAGLYFGASAIAVFYQDPDLTLVIRVLAFQFVLYSFETMPRAHLERALEFKKISVVEAVSSLTSGVVTMFLAYRGEGVWSLIWGYLCLVATRTVGLNVVAPYWHWPSLNFTNLKSHVAFSGFVTLDRILWFLFVECDRLIGGRIMGVQLLGSYAVSIDLASQPINKLAGIINSVAFPAFSKNIEIAALRSHFVKAVRMVSVLTFPVFLGLACTAPEFVQVFLGEKWKVIVTPLQILACVMPLRMVCILFPPLLWGMGKPDISAVNFVVAIVVLVPGFIGGAFYGPVGLAIAWCVCFPFAFAIMSWRTCRAIDLRMRTFGRALLAPTVAVGVMALTVAVVRSRQGLSESDLIRFCQLVATGVAAYIIVMVAIGRNQLIELIALVRRS